MRRTLPLLAAAALVLAGCGDDATSAGPSTPSAAATTTASPSSTPTPEPTQASTSPATTDGAADAPAPVEPVTDLLDWSPVPGADGATAASNGDWVLSVPEDGRSWTLEGAGGGEGMSVRRGFRITDSLISERWAVVVEQDQRERRPQRATIIELSTSQTFTLDGKSEVPTARGGVWAIDGDRLVHATESGQEYCLAHVDLTTRTSTKGWCAPGMDGFNYANLSAAGDAMLTFTSGQPSCRTVVRIEQGAVTPFPDVPECTGSEGALLEGGAIWSVVPDEQQYEQVQLYARTGDDLVDLGPGTNQTLTTCGSAAYFARDSDGGDDTAKLMRWDGTTLAVVYQSQPGQAFLDAPRCGGDQITVSAFSEGGDEQVTAPVS